MAIEDNLDQLYAEVIANRIIAVRLWGYLAAVFAKGGGVSAEAFLARQRKLSLESATLWSFDGHRDPERLRTMILDTINVAFDGISKAGSPGSPRQ